MDSLSFEETLERIEGFIQTGKPHHHVAVNVDKLIKVRSDPQLRQIVERSDLISVDGQPVVWASRLLGNRVKALVTGIDLMEALVARSAQRGWRVYFLGARAEVVARVADLYPRRYPGLQVAGARDGYWAAGDEDAVVASIRATRPHILFVGISSPKKEYFIHRHLRQLNVPFVMGVGGSFDIAAGVTRRAPRWLRQVGFEWFWRLLQEPRRMWRRYLVDDMKFLKLVAQELVGGRSSR
jgi:N-acetylglucosaminyldiphosphoundecaprenol N-acetyl-beta-D-mannosaminyltransferase